MRFKNHSFCFVNPGKGILKDSLNSTTTSSQTKIVKTIVYIYLLICWMMVPKERDGMHRMVRFAYRFHSLLNWSSCFKTLNANGAYRNHVFPIYYEDFTHRWRRQSLFQLTHFPMKFRDFHFGFVLQQFFQLFKSIWDKTNDKRQSQFIYSVWTNRMYTQTTRIVVWPGLTNVYIYIWGGENIFFRLVSLHSFVFAFVFVCVRICVTDKQAHKLNNGRTNIYLRFTLRRHTGHNIHNVNRSD